MLLGVVLVVDEVFDVGADDGQAHACEDFLEPAHVILLCLCVCLHVCVCVCVRLVRERERVRDSTTKPLHTKDTHPHTHTHTYTHLIILTNRHPRDHACIRREIQNAVPHHFGGCVDILDDEATPPAGGRELLLDCFAFAEVFDVFFVEFDGWGAGFEGLH